MTTLTNSFEGLAPSGTTVTSGSGGNTGGSSGSFFDAVSVGAGTTVASDSAHPAHGTLGLKIATGATSTTAYVSWTTSMGTKATTWMRANLYFTAAPAANTRVLNFVGAASSRGNVLATPAGKLIFTNAAGTTILTSAAFPLNAVFRLEVKFTGDATVGQWEYKIWNSPDSTGTPDDTQASAANLNTGGTTDTYRFGVGNAIANAGPYWMDDVGLSDTAYLGPAGPGTGTDTGSAADTATMSAAGSDGDAASGADTGSLAASLAGSDTASGADSATLAASIAGTDTAGGADTATMTAAVAGADSGSAADTAAMAAGLSGADAGSAADTASMGAALTAPDTTSGADTGTVSAGVAGSDTTAGADAASVAVALAGADAAVGADSAILAALLAAADSAAAADLAAMAAALPAGDTASAADTASVMIIAAHDVLQGRAALAGVLAGTGTAAGLRGSAAVTSSLSGG